MKKIFLILIALTCWINTVTSQTLKSQRTYDLTGKADIGNLRNISFDTLTQNIIVSFRVNSTSPPAKFEHHYFDREFNFIKREPEMQEAGHAEKKFPRRAKCRENFADTTKVTTIYVQEDDEIKLKKATLERSAVGRSKELFGMFPGDRTLETLKFESAEYPKYFHYRNWWTEQDIENAYLLTGVKDSNDALSFMKNFQLLKMNNKGEIVKIQEIRFDYPQEVIFPRFLDQYSERRAKEFENDIICLFAPKNVGNSLSFPDKSAYTFVRLNKNLEILDRITFTSRAAFWSLPDKYLSDMLDNAFYFIGPSLKISKGYYNDLKKTTKFDGFQILKISNHKAEYITEFSMDEFKKKLITSPDKKASPYEGRRFLIANSVVSTDGTLWVTGQQFTRNLLGVSYKDCFVFAFSGSGKLLGQYGLNVDKLEGSMDVPLIQEITYNEKSKTATWVLIKRNFSRDNLPASYIGKIDPENNKMSLFTDFQNKPKKKDSYFLCRFIPYILFEDEIWLFGYNKKPRGKELWFAKISLN